MALTCLESADFRKRLEEIPDPAASGTEFILPESGMPPQAERMPARENPDGRMPEFSRAPPKRPSISAIPCRIPFGSATDQFEATRMFNQGGVS